MLSESKIINFLKKNFPIPGGIGDDAAVLPLSEIEDYVVTNDLLIEDTHFKRRYFDAESLAHKVLHVNLSDLAAMGAEPLYIFLGASIPKESETYIDQFLQSFTKICKAHNVAPLGGDTTASPEKLFISATAIGKGQKDKLKFRHSAREGDIVCVAGHLGHAHIGFQALEKNVPNLDHFKDCFLKPTAHIQEGLWLGSKPTVHAMMDISDGLYIDLKKLCEASNSTGIIELNHLNPTQEFTKACHQLQLDPLQTYLTGGEDYGLLLTIDPKDYQSLATDFVKTFGYPLKEIGKISSGPKGAITLIQNSKEIDLDLKPFSHFGELSSENKKG